jgi:SAM-dependent methyltransferase
MEAKMMRLSLLFMVTTFMVKDVTSFCAYHKKSSSLITINQENNSEHPDEEVDIIIPSFHRRSLLLSTIFCGTHCSCCCGFPSSANALVELTQEPSSSNNNYLLRPRSKLMDNIFAQQMATGMVEYEKEVEQYKADLFQKLFDSLGDNGHSDNVPVVIVEVGMGTFPNAKFYAQALSSSAALKLNTTLDIVGVDPNESMVTYARDAYERELLGRSESSFRTVKGIAEALPFSDRSVDVVVSTLTLCSVVDQQKALSEICRVLKPNGKFLFWEHVLSEDNSALALQQTILNPLQTLSADGCHFNRRTGMNIEKVFGKDRVDVNYVTLGDKWVIGPTAFGIATA